MRARQRGHPPRRAAARRARGRSRRARGRGARRRASTSSSSGPRRRSSPGSPTRWPPRACAASGPVAAAARLEGSKAFAKEVMAAAGVPTGGVRGRARRRGGHGRDHRLPRGDQGRRAGGRQGRRDRRRRRRRRARRCTRCWSSAGSATSRSWSRSSSTATSSRCSRCATASARSRSRRRATTSGSATATPARTPAAWAASRPCPARDALVRDAIASVHQPVVDELARRGTPFHGVLYAGLMLGVAGPEGARVQRPLRRSRDPGRAAAAALRPARAAARGDGARRAGGRAARLGPAGRGLRRARVPRLPGELLVRRRHQRTRRAPARRRGVPRRAPRSATATS